MVSAAILVYREDQHFIPLCLTSGNAFIDHWFIGVTSEGVDESVFPDNSTTYSIEFNNFAEARNKLLEKIDYPWILTIDPDERLSVDFPKYKQFILNSPANVAGYGINIISPTRFPGGEFKVSEDYHLRLFRKGHSYNGFVHEQVTDSVNKVFCTTPKLMPQGHDLLEIYHLGYDRPPDVMKHKSLRNESLSLLEVQKNPNNTYQLFHLLTKYSIERDLLRAAQTAEKILSLNEYNNSIFYKTIIKYGYILFGLTEYIKAIDLITNYMNKIMILPEFLCQMNYIIFLCKKKLGRKGKGKKYLERAIKYADYDKTLKKNFLLKLYEIDYGKTSIN